MSKKFVGISVLKYNPRRTKSLGEDFRDEKT